MQCGELFERMLQASQGTLHVLIPSVSNASVTNWIRILAADRFANDAFRDHVLEILKRTDDLRAERNSLVHGIWTPGPVAGSALVQTVRFDRTDVIQDSLVTVADLNDLLSHLADVLRDISKAVERLRPNAS